MTLFKKLLLLLLLFVIGYVISYAWRAFPIMSGYSAKMLCSCTMVAGRNPADVINNELGRFPLSLANSSVNYKDSSTSSSVFGLARKKAIYRKGLGCTLLNKVSEEEVRNRKVHLATPPDLNRDTIPWPVGNFKSDTPHPEINYKKLEEALAYAFNETQPDSLRRTRAIVVVYDGQIVAERYAPGFSKDSKLTGWSMSKSLTNAIVGLLVRQNKIDIMEPVPIESWKNDKRALITLNDLLQSSSGLEWEENYNGPSGATNMLFREKDMGLYAAENPAAFEAGNIFEYSSGSTNIISHIIRKTLGDDDYYRAPYEHLFHKIGMYSLVLEPDAGGTFVGSSFSFATARDWARFGLLYLQDGVWNGEQLLPEGWVTYSTTPAQGAEKGEYGAQFWLNAGAPENPSYRIYPDLPTDLYWADGFEGQNVFILPSKKLVVVKLSLSHGDYLNDGKFLNDIIEAIN